MDVERVTLTPRTIIGVRERVAPEGMTGFFSRALERAYEALQEIGMAPAGPPMAAYRGDPTQGFDVIAGFPVIGTPTAPAGIAVVELPGGPGVTTIHTGSYDSMTDTYAGITAWMQEQHLTPAEPMWEEYLTDPEQEPDPAKWQTRIVFPVQP
jgi:effector-binding domain-containing protein